MIDEIDAWMTQARDADDREAFARVVEACHHLVRATLLRDTANTDLADELAQETLVRAWHRRAQYRSGTSPRAWLLAIARNQLIEHHRHQDRDRRHLRGLVQHELLRRRDNAAQEEGIGQHTRRIAVLRHYLQGIDPEHRELLDLVYARGLTTEAAAEALGLKPPACRQRLSRLLRMLRERLGSSLASEGAGP
jgi:RNA polymerase sigma-70 factor (ECF subfamily)